MHESPEEVGEGSYQGSLGKTEEPFVSVENQDMISLYSFHAVRQHHWMSEPASLGSILVALPNGLLGGVSTLAANSVAFL